MKVVRTNPKVFDRIEQLGSVRMKGTEVLWGEATTLKCPNTDINESPSCGKALRNGDSIIGIGVPVPVYRSCRAFSQSENCPDKPVSCDARAAPLTQGTLAQGQERTT